MKHLFFLFAMLAALDMHGQCGEFDNLIRKGDTFLRGSTPNYQRLYGGYPGML